ncbi:MAG: hypothetical protein ACTSXD_01090 [Candidatus Heimdallarchaeaceae archaeon]
MSIVDEYLAHLDESKKTSFVKVTRQTKIDRAIGALATKMAKELNDPWYKKMVKYRDKYFKTRKKIRTKYAPRVRSRAISGKGISDLIKKTKEEKKKK